jgi:hypothetical protein
LHKRTFDGRAILEHVIDLRRRAMELPFRVLLFRYLFFTWLFRDMRRHMSLLERAAAWRHNQEQSRWLPLYMLRYVVLGFSLAALGQAAQALSPILSAFFFVPSILTVPMLAVAGVCWSALQAWK